MICKKCGENHPISHFKKGPEEGMHTDCVTCRRKEAEENGLKCNSCHTVKLLSAFSKKDSLFGYNTICKKCLNTYQPIPKRYRDANRPVLYGIGSWNLIDRYPRGE